MFDPNAAPITRPNISLDLARAVAMRVFDLPGDVKELGSNQDRNFLVSSDPCNPQDKQRYLLKFDNDATPTWQLEEQSATLLSLAGEGLVVPAPVMHGGSPVVHATVKGQKLRARLLKFVEGESFVNDGHLSKSVVEGMGQLAGKVVVNLEKFQSQVGERQGGKNLRETDSQWDLRNASSVISALAPSVDAERRGLVLAATQKANAALAPLISHLPTQTIHGDITDDNVVGPRDEAGRVIPHGVIDWGDMGPGWRVAEIAVTVSSLLHHQSGADEGDGAHGVMPAIAAFDSLVHLNDAELEALWPLVVLRAAVLVVSGAHQVALEPDNAYARERMPHEWQIFEQASGFYKYAPLAHATICAAVGRPGPSPLPVPKYSLLPGLTLERVPLDVLSPHMDRGAWMDPETETRLARASASAGHAAVFAYGEHRLTMSGLFPPAKIQPENGALVMSVYVDKQTALVAPYDGEVIGGTAMVRAAPAAGKVDGPSKLDSAGTTMPEATSKPDLKTEAAIVLETAYGLVLLFLDASRLSIPTRSTTASWRVKAGETLGSISGHTCVDIQFIRPEAQPLLPVGEPGYRSFARFGHSAGMPALKRLTADPWVLLGLSSDISGSGSNFHLDVVAERNRRDKVMAPAAEKYYAGSAPLFERGWREILLDSSGRQYIDMVNNVSAIGHGHPAMADAIHSQLLRLNTNSRFLYASLADYIERLVALAPHPSLSQVLLVNSGSEAIELALRLARQHTRRKDVIVLGEAYHGWTVASDAVSTSAYDNPGAVGTRPAWVHVAEAPNAYRGKYTDDDHGRAVAEEEAQAKAKAKATTPRTETESTGTTKKTERPRNTSGNSITDIGDIGACYAHNVDSLLTSLKDAKTPAGAFLSEPIFGNGGGVIPPPGYLPLVYASVRAQGGVCIADEVQVGLGRLGRYTWGVEQQGVVPDILCVAKALGNGYPLGAVYTTKEIAASLSSDGMFFSSAGGATASAVAGLAVLNAIRDEKLQENATIVGDVLTQGFKDLMDKHEIIGHVHGMGLYQGVELVRSRTTKEPATTETEWVCDRLLDFGVIVQSTSERRNVLKIKPPMTLSRENALRVVKALDEVLGEMETRMEGV